MLSIVTNVQPKIASIRKIIHIILSGLIFCLFTGPLMAQVKFYTLVSESSISMRQTFQVQYIIEGANSIRQFNIPRFKDFEIKAAFDYPGRSVAGNASGVDSYSKIIVLLATKKGRFVIPAASAVINGKPMRSNTVKIAVTPGIPGLNNLGPDDIDIEEESMLRPGDNIDGKIKKNLFLRVEPSKTTCYVGEPLMVVYKAYSRLNATSQVVKRPSLTGFSVMEMVDAYDNKPDIEKLNGRTYYTNLVRKVQLFPLQEGEYMLDPAEIESVIHFIQTDEPAGRKSPMRSLYNRNKPILPSAINHRVVLRTEPQTIIVKPLPTANQPADFSGAVGRFALIVRVPTAPIHQGDLVKIQVVISGSGNLSLLTPPPIKWPKGVDTAEPAVKENINKFVFPLSGSKTFEYSFAAPDTGAYVIPAIHLSYYDPGEKKYKTASSDSITLHVLPGAPKKASDKEDRLVRDHLVINPVFYWFTGIVLVIIGSIAYQVISLRKAKKLAAAKAATPVKEVPPAPKTATELLANAKLALQNQRQQAFYYEVQQALWTVVGDTYQVLPSKMNKHHTTQLLAEKGVSAGTIHQFSAVLDECEWALYTPDQSVTSMETLLGKAEVVLNGLLEIKA